MKNLFLLLITIFILSCCDKDSNAFTGNNQLPAETQTGANTAGCLINGKVFIPKQQGLNPSINCNYEFINGKYYFNLVINENITSGLKSVSVRTSEINLQENFTYTLNKENTIFQPFTGGGAYFGINASNYFYTTTTKTGELKITRLDVSNSIISGTFWFDAINLQGENVEIKQGRFDMKY